ncbi:C2 calcium-dependent domain-containing protein 4A-like [Onychostruthus taczanowskii]|uniref:C2 calcium-dependent domain-containing protein 4A-like n=1 Tax=Onychostruthus taczanowskii TaxID=356909 RepID=UPI001B808F33|nr:C2 calcium-dependent domain-containing protein 4A-like [Onychostruthus taczanowskii]
MATLCPPALQGSGSRDIFFQVVTPDRIPQFVIPPLDIHKKRRCSGKGTGEGTAWRSSWDAAARDEHGSNSSSFNSSCSNPDPTALAALSLPHLPKVTTPYGFVTLGRSPQVTSEEAFFHSGSGHPRGLCRRHPGIPAAEEDSGMGGSQRDHKQPSPRVSGHKDDGSSPTPAGLPLARCARDIRITEALESQEAGKRDRRLLGTDCPRSSSLELPVATARRNLLQRILRRHLVHPRQLKPGHFTLH